MAAQTLNDVLSRTREFHKGLAESLNRSAADNQDVRAKLLLDYLQSHEEKLANALKTFQETAELKQLDTWFYEFAQKHNVIRSGQHHKPFSEMTTDEILAEVMDEHQQVIQLYRYLYGRAGTSPAGELLQELVELEQHEAMLLNREGERTDEL